MQNCTLKTTKPTIPRDFLLTNLAILSISKAHRQITWEFCIVKVMTMKKIQRIFSKVPFSLEDWIFIVHLTVFVLHGKLGINFLATLELLYPNLKVRIGLFRARPKFYMMGENPNVSLGIVDCSLYTRRVMLKEDYQKKENVSTSFRSSWLQLHGNLDKYLHSSCETELHHWKNFIQQRTYTSNSQCNEFKLYLYWLLCREPIQVSTVYSERY